MSDKKSLILSAAQIQQKLVRMANELFEQHYKKERFVLVGIEKRGFLLAQQIGAELQQLTGGKVDVYPITLDKKNPEKGNPSVSLSKNEIIGKTLFLVDDVLNSGKTLMYAAMHLMHLEPSMLQTIVLVNRRHRLFPIRADIVGLSLATTMKEHISVELAGKEKGVYLS